MFLNKSFLNVLFILIGIFSCIESQYDIYYQDLIDPTISDNLLNEILDGKAPLTAKNSFITDVVKYNSKLRPSGLFNTTKNVDKSGSLKISVMLSLRQIVSLDEKNQILTSSFYLLFKWNDPRLMWDPVAYKNLTSITAQASNFWLPDIAIMNSAASSNLLSLSTNQNAILIYDGSFFLTISLPSQQTRCKLNVYNYPFDSQNCSIVIGSWLTNSKEFDFSTNDDDDGIRFSIKNYLQSPTWNLKNIEQYSIVDTSRFDMANSEFLNLNLSKIKSEDIAFYLILKRNPLYIMINGILPCLVLNCVILFAFGAPFVQQINLCMTSLLTFVVTSLRISSDIPVQSEYLPLITLYMILSIVYTLLGFIWFITKDNLLKMKKLPTILFYISLYTKKLLSLKFKINNSQSKVQTRPIDRNSVEPVLVIENLDQVNEPNTKIVENEKKEDKISEKNFQKDPQKEIEHDVAILNYLAFISLFLIIITCNITIWISISN